MDAFSAEIENQLRDVSNLPCLSWEDQTCEYISFLSLFLVKPGSPPVRVLESQKLPESKMRIDYGWGVGVLGSGVLAGGVVEGCLIEGDTEWIFILIWFRHCGG